MTPQNRRSAIRKNVSVPCQIVRHEDTQVFAETTRDLSEDGMQIASDCTERFVGAGTRSPVRVGHRRNAAERSPERRAETAERATPSSYGDFAAGAQGDRAKLPADFRSWRTRARGETWAERSRARVVAGRRREVAGDGRTTPCSATTWSARRRTELTRAPPAEHARRGWRVERGCRRSAGSG